MERVGRVCGGVGRVTTAPASCPPGRKLPDFAIEIDTPDLDRWRGGQRWGYPASGPCVRPRRGRMCWSRALVHGNEIAGAVALDRLLRDGPRPLRGALTLGFVNLAAFDRFDPAQPTASRYVDEDMNRLWDATVLGRSAPVRRARPCRAPYAPLVEQADVLLDLHSMLWPSEPLILSGPTVRGPGAGRVHRHAGPCGGRHRACERPAADRLRSFRAVGAVAAWPCWLRRASTGSGRTVAAHAEGHRRRARRDRPGRRDGHRHAGYAVCGGDDGDQPPGLAGSPSCRISAAATWSAGPDTLIAMDGTVEIRTPHDDCLLVMPSLRPSRGHTAVRLARFV